MAHVRRFFSHSPDYGPTNVGTRARRVRRRASRLPEKRFYQGAREGVLREKSVFFRKCDFFVFSLQKYRPPQKITRAENPGKSGKIRGGICVLQIGASPAVSRENFPKCEPDRVGCMRTEQKPPDLGKLSAAERFGEPRPQFSAALSSLGSFWVVPAMRAVRVRSPWEALRSPWEAWFGPSCHVLRSEIAFGRLSTGRCKALPLSSRVVIAPFSYYRRDLVDF